MRSRGALLLTTAVLGVVFGFALTRIGFGDFGEVNRMFTFQDLRLLLTFAGAVAIAAVLSALVLPRPAPVRPLHRGILPGAALFGIGWAISGGCPAIPLVQLGSGYLPALGTLAGIVVGVRAGRWFAGRVHLDTGTCG
jgi:uncharacterized membrane protein YedE/YeeE